MKSTTWILKVEWYVDNKEDRNFLIYNTYTWKDLVSKLNLEKLYWKNLILDEKRLEKSKIKLEKKARNDKMFSKIDALDFIKAVNDDNWVFANVNITLSNSSVIWTFNSLNRGITNIKVVENEEGINYFNDFSGKWRSWNKGFLYNYIVKDLMLVKDFNKNKTILWSIWLFLNTNFWIKFTKWLDTTPLYDSFLNYNLTKNTLILEEWKGLDLDITNNNNKLILSFAKKGEIERVVTAINTIVLENDLDLIKETQISENDILKAMWISVQKTNKENLRNTMNLLSRLQVISKKVLEDWSTKTSFLNLFNYSIIEKNWFATKYELKRKYKSNKKVWIGKELVTMFKKAEHYHLAHQISCRISEFGSADFNIQNLKWEMGVSNNRYIKNILDKMKKSNYIREYNFTKTTLYIK